jgi:CHAT domain-containing protein
MVGLNRAFLVAGARNVGVSLWAVSDAGTAAFMERLYAKALAEGKPFREAYYEAKRELRNDPDYGHPFFWACFTMYE